MQTTIIRKQEPQPDHRLTQFRLAFYKVLGEDSTALTMSEQEGDEGRFVVRCRGLPWSCSVEEIVNFFEGCELAEGTDSVHMTMNREGRPSGEAYVELASKEDYDEALKKDRQSMGKRYVEGKRQPMNTQQIFLHNATRFLQCLKANTAKWSGF